MAEGSEHDRVGPEPFPWMSTNKPTGPYRFTLKTPASEAVFGTFLLLVGVAFAAQALQDTAWQAGVLAALFLLVFAGLGGLLIVMAVRRHRWAKAYERVHGYRPF